MKKYPLDANKISIAGVALDGTTLERSAQLETNMIAGKYESAKDASLAALQWYQDSGYIVHHYQEILAPLCSTHFLG